MSEKLEALKKQWARIANLNQVASVLHWDMETYMPEEGIKARSEQLAIMSELIHQVLVSDETGRIIEDAEEENAGGEYFSHEVSMVRAARREYDKTAKIPEDLAVRMTRTTAEGNSVWVKARRESDFSSFAPVLSEIIELNLEMAECLGYDGHIYDALLDLYEPEMTTAEVETLFQKLKNDLVPLVRNISESGKKPDASVLDQNFARKGQEDFGLEVLKSMGYDFKRGRQDESAHPFTTSFSPYDVRITTRFAEEDLLSALFSTIHEGGHALYDQGLPLDFLNTPLCAPVSLGVHESQSRLWENIIGRSREFWKHYFPLLKKHFPGQLDKTDAEGFYRAVNRVSPGLIRVESDEVTYNLHIFIRFEIEKDLLSGSLKVEDIPAAWNEKYREYLGLNPPDDARGCLQDIHWAHGAFGYFPTYTIGNIISSQLFNQAARDLPSLPGDIERGDFSGLHGWLKMNVHSHGMRYTTEELVDKICGGPIDVKPFMTYLREKYGELYDL